MTTAPRMSVVLTLMAAVRAVLPRRLTRGVRRAAGLVRAPFTRARAGAGVRPLSDLWGFDRGFPVHRYYLERFLAVHAGDIRGRCLEFQSDDYTTRFGGAAVTRLDILHLDDRNPLATLVGDLTRENDLPDETFDCIVCTHVLHVIDDLPVALAKLRSMLKSAGVLLIAVPHVSMCGETERELWRFTPDGLRSVLGRTFGPAHVTVEGYGNSLTAAGELRGLTADEFTSAELLAHDPRFPVEVCARAVKAP